MLSVTHAIIAAAAAACLPAPPDPLIFGLSILGGLLPDIDTTASFPGRIVYPIARFLETRGEHRGFTHSLTFTGILLVLLFPLYSIKGWAYWVALPLGHLINCYADAATKTGIRLFWPSRKMCVIGLNPRYRITTGTGAEAPIIFICVVIIAVMININGSFGGMTDFFSQNFMPTKDTAVRLFQRVGTSSQVEVAIQGRHATTTQPVSGSYQVLDVVSGDLIVADNAGIPYRVGFGQEAQIKPTSIKASVGAGVAIKSFEQQVIEADADQWIASLSPTAYLIGTLNIDDGAELRQPQQLNSMPVITVGAITTLNYARVADLKPLAGSWITSGNVVIKEVISNGTVRSSL